MNTRWKWEAFTLLERNGVVNPLFKTKTYVSNCQQGANRDFECHCNQKSINKGMWSVLKCLRFWRSNWKRIVFPTHHFQMYAFSLVFLKAPFSQRSKCERRAKRISFTPFSYENVAVWTGSNAAMLLRTAKFQDVTILLSSFFQHIRLEGDPYGNRVSLTL